jgi:hypothetical protein
MIDDFADFIGTWFQPGAKAKLRHKLFQRLLIGGQKPLKRFFASSVWVHQASAGC